MATAKWTPLDGEAVVKMFATPKRASSLLYWLKNARRAIPQIPQFSDGSQATADMSPDRIKVYWPDFGWLDIDRTTRRTL